MTSTLAAVLAQEGPALNTDGIIAWVSRSILPLVLLFIGVLIIAGAKKGKMSDNAGTLANVLVGLLFIGGAGVLIALGDDLAGLVFGG